MYPTKSLMLSVVLVFSSAACGKRKSFPLSHTTQRARIEQHQASAYFELTDQQILQVITALKSFISIEHPIIGPEFEKYCFQLTPYRSSDQDLVFINAFHESDIKDVPDWQTRPWSVKGGGHYYWRARYSLRTNSVLECWVNSDK